MSFQGRGKYYEELTIGSEIPMPTRTVFEVDVVNFACFSGDFAPLHVDRSYASQTIFGDNVAHGLIQLAFVTGWLDKIGLLEGTGQAFHGIEWKWKKPVKFGDTISGTLTVIEGRTSSLPGSGVIKFGVIVTNQRGEEVSEGKMEMMVKRVPVTTTKS